MTKFSVPDMSCGHCVATIRKAVAAVDEAATVTCDLSDHSVDIGSSAEPNALATALKDAGYPAERID